MPPTQPAIAILRRMELVLLQRLAVVVAVAPLGLPYRLD